MKRISFLLVLTAGLSIGSTLTYTNGMAWQAAAEGGAATVLQPFVGSNADSIPGLSFITRAGMGSVDTAGLGHFENGTWTDCVDKTGCAGADYDSTQMVYSGVLSGFVGIFDIAPTDHGLEVYETLLDGIVQEETICPNPLSEGGCGAYAGTWGVISSQPFSTVTFADSVGDAYWRMSNLELSVVDRDTAASVTPEPDTIGLIGIGFLTIVVSGRYLKHRKGAGAYTTAGL